MAKLIRGGTLVTAEREERADLLCDKGVIVASGNNLDIPAGCEVIDAGGC